MWIYDKETITDISQVPQGAIGFIYLLTNIETGKFYIGKKNLYTERTKHLGKKELEARSDKRQSKKKKVIKESDWLNYNSSNELINKEIEQGELFSKEIIEFCYNKKQLTYYEVYYQFKYDVLRENSYNSNIQGKFFKKDL
jgi:hypothetical protein